MLHSEAFMNMYEMNTLSSFKAESPHQVCWLGQTVYKTGFLENAAHGTSIEQC